MMIRRSLPWLLVGGAAAALGACGGVDVGFDSPNPQGRTLALVRASEARDPSAIPKMIVLLNSIDSAERMLAIRGLERETGETFGYRHYAPEDERLAAQKRWAEWWSEQQDDGEVSR